MITYTRTFPSLLQIEGVRTGGVGPGDIAETDGVMAARLGADIAPPPPSVPGPALSSSLPVNQPQALTAWINDCKKYITVIMI